jgi:hypothetical protein
MPEPASMNRSSPASPVTQRPTWYDDMGCFANHEVWRWRTAVDSQSNSKSSFDQFAWSTDEHRHMMAITSASDCAASGRHGGNFLGCWQLQFMRYSLPGTAVLAGLRESQPRGCWQARARSRRGRAWPSAARDEQLAASCLGGWRGAGWSRLTQVPSPGAVQSSRYHTQY